MKVEYNNGTDMDKAEEVLKKEIDKIDFKDGVSEPELIRNSIDAFPIVAYSFTNKSNDLRTTTKEINEQLIPKLQTVDGVQSAQLNGQTTRQVTLKFKQKELDKVRLSADDVENYIKTATRETPLGLFQFGNNEKSLVVDGQFKSVSALKDLKIPLSIAGQGQSSDSNDNSISSTGQEGSQSSSASQSQTNSSLKGTNGQMPSVPLKDLANITVGDERDSISKQMVKTQ